MGPDTLMGMCSPTWQEPCTSRKSRRRRSLPQRQLGSVSMIQYHADGVDGVMAVESVNQAFGGAVRGRFVAERDLRLDDRMQGGVHRSVRQPNTRGAAKLRPIFSLR